MSFLGVEDREALGSIEVHMVMEIQFLVKVEAEVLPDGLGGKDKAPH